MISCLRGAGVEVVEEHVSVWDDDRHGWGAGPTRALRLAAAEARLLARRPPDADALIVGYPGHFDLPAARRAARGRPVVFNPLVSLADTLVADRGRFRPGSFAARALETVDRRAFRAADVVVADTAADAQFFAGLAGLDECPSALSAPRTGCSTPNWSPPDRFVALFVGKLIPLQGSRRSWRQRGKRRRSTSGSSAAASSKACSQLCRRTSSTCRGSSTSSCRRRSNAAGCSLGIFGASGKAQRVIPNKAFQALACAAPLVTADTPAARELLVDEESALLVPPGDAEPSRTQCAGWPPTPS